VLLSTFSVLATFTSSNGANPYDTPIMDSHGNLYGTTSGVGTTPITNGTIWEIVAGSGSITTLHTFNGTDGANPDDKLLLDSNGNLFGTTFNGGTNNIGSIFEYSTSTGNFTSVYSFKTPADGLTAASPYGELIMDGSGNLFGTTKVGGAYGKGSIFELAKSGSTYSSSIQTLHSFTTAATDGKNPYGGLVMDGSGNLYGTARQGGDANNDGTLFEYATSTSTFSVLHTFAITTDGREPDDTLIMDSSGNLYGTCQAGGANNDGTVFKYNTHTGTLTALYSFLPNGTDGKLPYASLVMDARGDLFGTDTAGGAQNAGAVFEIPAGSSTDLILHFFNGAADGAAPYGGLFMDSRGNLYGTTETSTTTTIYGTIFEIASTPQLAFVQQPSNTTVNSYISPAMTVDIKDEWGNIITTDNSNVTLSVHSGSGSLSGTTRVAAVNGVATFSNVDITAAGNYTLTATDGSDTSATSNSFTVSPSTDAKVVFAQQPSTIAAGSTISPAITVDVEDQNGNLVTTDNSNVTLSVHSGPGSLIGTLNATALGGVATFSDITITTEGSYTLTAADGSLSSATSNSFSVTSALSTHYLVFSQQPTNTVAGSTISPDVTVQVQDEYGNLVTSDDSQVTLSLCSGPGSLSGTLNATVSGGVATFSDLSITTVGDYTLTAADGRLTSVTSDSFTISPAAAAKVTFAQQPTAANIYSTISPAVIVQVEDLYGNLITTDSSSVTLSVQSGPGSLSGTLNATASGGVATFSDLSCDTPGNYTLAAADGNLTSAISISFTISPIPASQIIIGPQQVTAAEYGMISPNIILAVEDPHGNPVASDTSSVTASILSGPAGAQLVGTPTEPVINGYATFDNLTGSTPGDYRLLFTDGNLTTATSVNFHVFSIPLKYRWWYGSMPLSVPVTVRPPDLPFVAPPSDSASPPGSFVAGGLTSPTSPGADGTVPSSNATGWLATSGDDVWD